MLALGVLLGLGQCHPTATLHPSPALCLQKVESGSDSDSKVDSDLEMGNATVDMTKSDSDSDSDVSVKKAPRGRKPGTPGLLLLLPPPRDGTVAAQAFPRLWHSIPNSGHILEPLCLWSSGLFYQKDLQGSC